MISPSLFVNFCIDARDEEAEGIAASLLVEALPGGLPVSLLGQLHEDLTWVNVSQAHELRLLDDLQDQDVDHVVELKRGIALHPG
jgi:hypothetical protein